MSTEQSVDQESLEATRQQLRGLVHEIESLSRSDVELAQFYEGFLNRIVTAMAAVGGAIWSVNANGQLSLAYQINLRETRLAENEEDQQKHGRLLHRVLTSRQPMLVAPQSSDEESGAANPTHCQLILSPMQSDKEEVDAVLEIFQRPGATPATERGYLRFVLRDVRAGGRLPQDPPPQALQRAANPVGSARNIHARARTKASTRAIRRTPSPTKAAG